MRWEIVYGTFDLYSAVNNKLARIIESRPKLFVYITVEKEPFYSKFYSSLEECMKDCKVFCVENGIL